MPGKSQISWTGKTWNPATGCKQVSPGCAYCYAETFAERFRGVPGHAYEQGFDLRLWPQRLSVPLRWAAPTLIFVNSMSDLFLEDIPNEFIAAVFGVMAATPRHVFQVLTKRPARALEWFAWLDREARERGAAGRPWLVCQDEAQKLTPALPPAGLLAAWPLPNVWLGVTIESARFVDRADMLRALPAAVRFISAEPLLGRLTGNVLSDAQCEAAEARLPLDSPLTMPRPNETVQAWWARLHRDLAPNLNLTAIDLLIVGGESAGPLPRRLVDEHNEPRPDRLEWVRALRDACLATGTTCERCHGRAGHPEPSGTCVGVYDGCGWELPWCPACGFAGRRGGTAFHLKQWGGPRTNSGGRTLDHREWTELPHAAEGLHDLTTATGAASP